VAFLLLAAVIASLGAAALFVTHGASRPQGLSGGA
jgi:hypothetical protein